MAQTRRKRQTKHRGNAAGEIESRGRTGRPLSATEKKGPAAKAQKREARLNRKPTWKGSAQRALLAGAFIFVFLMLIGNHKKGSSAVLSSLIFAVIATLFYVFFGFYFETFMWRRRMAKKQPAKSR
jgi:hypothetical protein